MPIQPQIEDTVGGVKRVMDTQLYEVHPNSVVLLTITIGDAQQGGSGYLFEDRMVTGSPNFADHPVNRAEESPKKKILHCETKVVDIQPNMNRTSVTFTLKGGVMERSYPYATDVSENNGFANYLINFVFV